MKKTMLWLGVCSALAGLAVARVGERGSTACTYIQKVPLAGLTAEPEASFNVAGRTISLKHKDDYVALSRRYVPEVTISNSEVVFVGYGIVAPEYGWDDYKGVDVRGKTILMLINDPPIPDPLDS